MAIKLTPEQNKLAQKLFALDVPEFPGTIGGCVDQLYKLREDRIALQRNVDELKKQEKELKDHIYEEFGENELDGARGKVASAHLVRSTVAHINDFEAACRWIARREAWDLLYRRISDPAYRLRIEERIAVDGVEPFPATNLSLVKAKR